MFVNSTADDKPTLFQPMARSRLLAPLGAQCQKATLLDVFLATFRQSLRTSYKQVMTPSVCLQQYILRSKGSHGGAPTTMNASNSGRSDWAYNTTTAVAQGLQILLVRPFFLANIAVASIIGVCWGLSHGIIKAAKAVCGGGQQFSPKFAHAAANRNGLFPKNRSASSDQIWLPQNAGQFKIKSHQCSLLFCKKEMLLDGEQGVAFRKTVKMFFSENSTDEQRRLSLSQLNLAALECLMLEMDEPGNIHGLQENQNIIYAQLFDVLSVAGDFSARRKIIKDYVVRMHPDKNGPLSGDFGSEFRNMGQQALWDLVKKLNKWSAQQIDT